MRADALGLFWQDMPKMPKEAKEKENYLPPQQFWKFADYLPYINEARAFNVPIMSDRELLEAVQNNHAFVFDIESYINYFLIAFKDKVTKKVIYFEKIGTDYGDSPWNDHPGKLKWMMDNAFILGFNSNNYDMCIAALGLAEKEVKQLKAATNMIIGEGYRPWHVLRKLKVPKLESNHIDIMEVAPLTGSLKIYGGRAGTAKMQDLPFHPEVELNKDQIDVTRFYCINDLDTTADLADELKEDMDLREHLSREYGIDLRSKSDAQIAEAVIAHELEKLNFSKPVKPNIEPGTAYRYKIPHFMQFQTPLMQNVLNLVQTTLFVVSEKGSVGMPPQLANLKIQIGNSVYKMGIGGLHSTEKKTTHFSDDLWQLSDHDVTSYYPFIILNLGLYPQHLGVNFLAVYRAIVERRLAAKARGDDAVAGALKIVINGTFGKLGSPWSIFYSPDLLIQVTLTGQLSLLMLIEQFELAGIPVVSANTDGIVIKCPKSKFEVREQILQWWQDVTKFNLEANEYKILASKDVNNYFAVKMDGKVKGKGLYAKPGLRKNPTTTICSEAVQKLFSDNIPLEDTIKACTDMHKFISVRSVSGGAVWGRYHQELPERCSQEEMENQLRNTGWVEVESGMWVTREAMEGGGDYLKGAVTTVEAYKSARWMPIESDYLGKAIRWYYAKVPEGELYRTVYAKNGNKVPKSDGAKPLMEMDRKVLPDDLDLDWYVKEAERILVDVGYTV